MPSHMVQPVSLSNPAFAALGAEKRPNESYSDVVLRLVRKVQADRRHARAFLRYRPKRSLSFEKYRAGVRAMDEADRIR